MAAAKPTPATQDRVLEKLMDGTYERQLAEFEARIAQAAAMLRRAYEAMKAENTPRS